MSYLRQRLAAGPANTFCLLLFSVTLAGLWAGQAISRGAASSLRPSPGFTRSPPVDPYEPNDHFGQAVWIEPAAGSRYGYLWPAEDEDWFWFPVPEGGAYRIESWLDSLPLGVDYRLAVFHPDGSLLRETPGAAGGPIALRLAVDAGGAYRVRVRSAAGGDAWDAYRLRVLVSPLPTADLALGMATRQVAGPGLAHAISLLVDNGGPDAAHGIQLTAAWPPGVAYLGISAPGGWTCHRVRAQVQCRHPGPLWPGDQMPAVTLRLYQRRGGSGGVTITAQAASEGYDPNPENNRLPSP